MDGTLTVACHDFDGIRAKLGLPAGLPILEELKKYPEKKAAMLHQQLYDMEMELAYQARPQPGIEVLLDHLFQQQRSIGIVTRNSLEIAFTTLKACGLISYFKPENILGRECCAPKPDPEGVLKLMQQWGCDAEQTVMVGDYLFDLQSGHAAGIYTVHFDSVGLDTWPEVTDHRISSFSDITNLIVN